MFHVAIEHFGLDQKNSCISIVVCATGPLWSSLWLSVATLLMTAQKHSGEQVLDVENTSACKFATWQEVRVVGCSRSPRLFLQPTTGKLSTGLQALLIVQMCIRNRLYA